MRRRAAGFTVVELLVVISLIVLLIALLLPALGSAREWARRQTCMSNQRQIGVAWFAYAGDNDGQFPLNVSAAAFAFTSRTGFGWADSRSRIDPYIATPRIMYCPSGGDTLTSPNIHNYQTFTINASAQGWSKLAGWNAIPFDIPADFYVHSDYTVFPGFVRTNNKRLMTYLFGPDEAITELAGFGFDRPTIPDRVSRNVSNGASPADVPLSADMAYSQDPTLLTSVMHGEFVYWEDPYSSAGNRTILKSHLRSGQGFDGIATSFMDGHTEWRRRGVAGPRTNLYTNGANYNYVTWY